MDCRVDTESEWGKCGWMWVEVGGGRCVKCKGWLLKKTVCDNFSRKS